jgi:hypothetical protein
MASKKLHQAVAAGTVVVQNRQSAEVNLHIKGQPHRLARNERLDLTNICTAKECLSIGGLHDLLKKGHLVLL